ncbi:D-alanine--D-alanine ligase [Clostridia bacterium]|nr:D-alanine--D-alanine ligase [Clostridia bacterium]
MEHEVSVISALQAAKNLTKYDIVPVYISKENEFFTGEALLDITLYRDIPSLLRKTTRVIFQKDDNGRTGLYRFPPKKLADNFIAGFDFCLPVTHGTTVEDGALQGFLKFQGIPFAGSDVTASAAGMDKFLTKTIAREAGVPVLPGAAVSVGQYIADSAAAFSRIERAVPYPMIVKPLNLGSSVGIKIAADRAELKVAAEHAFMFSGDLIAERAVTNLREVNVSVLGDKDGARASVCEEPIASGAILSYEDKYGESGKGGKQSGMASLKRKIPADITAAQEAAIGNYAVAAFRAVGASGVARCDFIIDGDEADGGGEKGIYLNEINTIPGSLSFYLWEKSGLPYVNLLEEIIKLGKKRTREEKSVNFSFRTNILQDAKFSSKTGKS